MDKENIDCNVDEAESRKKNYYEEIVKFAKIMTFNKVTPKELDNSVEMCLSILDKHKEKNKIYIKACNKKTKLACKFLSYYYGLNVEQKFEQNVIKFTCCQYRLNGNKISRVNFVENPKKCNCKNDIQINDKTKFLQKSKNFTHYEHKTDLLRFYFEV